MPVPENYRRAPLEEAERYARAVAKLREMQRVALRFRYVFGGSMWWRGFFILRYKDESDIIMPDDHNALVEFFRLFYELVSEEL